MSAGVGLPVIRPGINVSLSGNTSGTLALINSGTLYLAGGTNVTLSQNGNSVTISAGGGGGAGGANVSLSGNTSGTLALISTGTFYLAGGNNVTLSQNGNSVTISAFNQTVQTQNLVDLSLSGNTSGTLALISSGTALLAGGNNITLSQNGQSITVSAANQTVQTQNLVDVSLSGNTSGALALVSSGTFILAGGNNVTLSQNGQSVTVSAANQTVQTQNLHDLSLSGNTSGVLALISSGTAILAGGNNITLSQNGQSVTVSAANQTAQTQNLVDLTLAGNTTGTLALMSSGTVSIAGGNNVTLSQANGNAFTISAANQTVQTQNLFDLSLSGNTSGTLALVSSGTGILAGGNNITLSQNGQSITVSAANQTVQTQNLVDVTLAGNTSGTLALVSSGTLTLAGGNNVTLSQVGNAVTVSAFNQTVQTQNLFDLSLSGNTSGALALISSGTGILAGGNNVTLSQNGQSVTISQAQYLSSFECIPAINLTNQIGLASRSTANLSFVPYIIPEYVLARHANLIFDMTITTVGTSSYSATHQFMWALYTRDTGANSTRLNSFTSSSFSIQETVNNSSYTFSQATTTNDTGYGYGSTTSAGVNITSQYTGFKFVQALMLTTLSPNVYWLAMQQLLTTAGGTTGGISASLVGISAVFSAIAPIGSLSSAFLSGTNLALGIGGVLPSFMGVASTNTGFTAFPANFPISALTTASMLIPYLSFGTTA